DDPGRPVLVPDPDVLHPQVEERVVRLGELREVELVAEVGRVLGEDAIPEQAEDGRVLPLQPELELRLEFVELVEMAHRDITSPPSLASSGVTEPVPARGPRGRDPARPGARGRTCARAAAGAERRARA